MADGEKKIWVELKVRVLASESELNDKTKEMGSLHTQAINAFAGNVVETSITMKPNE